MMHCDQCEQTSHGIACANSVGVCGKDADLESLQKTLLYALKGLAAYKHHARRLGKTDPEVEAFIEEALFSTLTNVNFDKDLAVELLLECGRMNLRTMELLNEGHVELLGTPTPVSVNEGIQEGMGILVTGHDMADLKQILEQTAGTGIKVYTHGEMLPAHSYPELRKHPHLAGHYGGAWQDQRAEFEAFGGPVVATTNCVLIPGMTHTYLNRLFTTGITGVPGAMRIRGINFTPVIERAMEIGRLRPTQLKPVTVGFHYTTVLSLADAIVAAVKSGQVKHFFVIGGCDGIEPSRNYFREFAEHTPEESLILTLGCGKYRLRGPDYGTIKLGDVEIPRLLDIGQCNDTYGAIQIALALAKAFECGVNDLPLTLLVSWLEQKAVAVLLTLLYLDVRNIRLGPSLPAFITPNVLALLQEKYELKAMGNNPAADVAEAMRGGN